MKFAKEIKESPTLKLAELARKRKEKGQKVISFAVGEPDFKTPQFIIDKTIEALNAGYTGYSTPQGILELREKIALSFNQKYNSNYSSEETIIFPGAKAAIFATLASILEADDEVIIISPYYVSYPALIKLAEPNSKIIEIFMDEDFKLPLEKIKEAITPSTKAIILNYPNNPTGQLLNLDEIREVVEIVKNNNLYLISDEIYDQIVLEGNEFYSFSSFLDIKDKTIIINGFSKAYAMTGFRIGYALANQELVKKMNLFNQNTNTNTNTFVQRGCLAVFENDNNHLQEYNKALEAKINYLHQEINKSVYFKGIKPQGAFYYFLDITETKMDSLTFSNYLINNYGIVATPGIAFGKDYDNYLRLSLSLNFEDLKEAVEILKNLKIKGDE